MTIHNSRIKHWLKKGLLTALIFEAVYLVLFNLALNLPLTQTLVNKIKPDKFLVYWDSAWTLYPFRVHANGVSVNGQSQSQQWQVEINSASASIALLPLILRKVKLYDMHATDLEYFQRPRLKADKDVTDINEFFPPIRDREINKAVTTAKKKRKPWNITLDNIVATGSHTFWVYQIRGAVEGDLQFDLSFQTQGGPFSASHGKADIDLESLFIHGNREVLKQGHIKGSVEISPIVFKQNRGIKSLAFITLDTEIGAEVGSLAFLNLYLNAFKGLNVDGNGQLTGRLRFDKGTLLPQTHLQIDANKLFLSLLEHRVEGDGIIRLDVSTKEPDELSIEILFTDLDAFHEQDKQPLFVGHGLSVTARGGASLFPLENRGSDISYLGVTVPSVIVPDLSAYQRYLPDKWRFNLYHGMGKIQGKAELSTTAFNADLKLTSTDADVGIAEHRFKTDLDFGLFIDSPSFKSAIVDISGSYLRLNDQRLSSKERGESQSWQSALFIDKGTLKLHLPKAPEELSGAGTDLEQLSEALKQQDLKDLLAVAEVELIINGSISQLEWISILFKNSFNMGISGSGQLAANLRIISGWPAKDSKIEIKPDKLEVDLLDYVFKGDGLLTFEVEKGGESPNVAFNVEVTDALFKRHEEEQAFIEDVVLKIQGLGRNLGYDGPGKDLELRLQIPSAKVKDMSVYNQYLPEQSPLQLSGGQADLWADINLKPESAQGFVKLKTRGLQSRLDDQQVSGELSVDINIADGVPRNMDFDISGSSLLLDKVRVIGEQKNFEQSEWNAKIYLNKAKIIYKKPVRLHTEAEIEIKDSRPIVAMLANHREKHGWLSKMLTIENIKGIARMDIEHQEIVIPYAFFDSDKVDLGAKGIINAQTHDGVFYARYGKLKGLLKVKDGKRNFDIIRAKQKFDEYSPVIK
jgi:hypothetical protein